MQLGIYEAWRARISLLQGHKLTIYVSCVHPSIARDLNPQSQRYEYCQMALCSSSTGKSSNMGSKKPSCYACEAIKCRFSDMFSARNIFQIMMSPTKRGQSNVR